MDKQFIGRIPKGSDIQSYLCGLFLDNKMGSAWVSLIGAVESATLSYYSQSRQRYLKKDFYRSAEILSGQGNISWKEQQPFCHLHLSLADSEFNVFGGHLEKSSVFACEYLLTSLNSSKERSYDEETGLNLWPMK